MYYIKVRPIPVIDHSRCFPPPAWGCRASPYLLSSDGYLESLLAVELKHVVLFQRKKKWSEFISLNCIGTLIIPRKEWWSEFISWNCIGTLIIPRQGWSVILCIFLDLPTFQTLSPGLRRMLTLIFSEWLRILNSKVVWHSP